MLGTSMDQVERTASEFLSKRPHEGERDKEIVLLLTAINRKIQRKHEGRNFSVMCCVPFQCFLNFACIQYG